MRQLGIVTATAMAIVSLYSQGQTVKTSGSQPATTGATTGASAVVVGIDKDALLKELRFNPNRQETSQLGWSMANTEARKGEIFQVTVAVCGSREAARELYTQRVMSLSAEPRSPLGRFAVGSLSTVGAGSALFVRDNVVVSILWKEAVPDADLLTQVDNYLMTASSLMSRGQFTVVPKLKDVPTTTSVAPGESKDIPIAWEGMGQASPTLWVSSPGAMANQVTDGTVRLKVLREANEEDYPVNVCAVGDRLLFATATIDVFVRRSQTPATQPREPGR